MAIEADRAAITAWELSHRLSQGHPPVFVRDQEAELGHLLIDPCNLHPGEAEIVAERVCEELTRAHGEKGGPRLGLAELKARRYRSLVNWPD